MTGIVAIAVISSGLMLDSANIQTAAQTTTIQEPPENGPLPYEQKNRSGLPMLDAIEIEKPNLDTLTFKELTKGQYDFIWRAINNGATYLSDKELETYFTEISEPRHRFVINDGDSLRYYRLAYSAPPLSYDQHYIKVLEYAEERNNINFKNLDQASKSRIDVQLLKPYRWIPISESDAVALKQNMVRDGTFFTANIERGDTKFQIQYLGPLGEEYKNPDFVAMLGGDHHE
jgi:hypothetical protein